MPITNRNRFPDVNFLPDSKIRPFGSVGSINLVLVGTERGTNTPVVAKTYTVNPTKENLFAIPLYELMKHTQDALVQL